MCPDSLCASGEVTQQHELSTHLLLQPADRRARPAAAAGGFAVQLGCLVLPPAGIITPGSKHVWERLHNNVEQTHRCSLLRQFTRERGNVKLPYQLHGHTPGSGVPISN